MIDIIERLRAEIDPDVNEPIDRLLEDAAEEIAHLRLALMQIDSIAVGKKAGAAREMQSVARAAVSQAHQQQSQKSLTETIRDIRALVAAHGGLDHSIQEPSSLNEDYALPCDVFLGPATVIRKGCKLSTLLNAFRAREGKDWARFDLSDAKDAIARYRQAVGGQ